MGQLKKQRRGSRGPKYVVAMILKDEAETIAQTLASIKKTLGRSLRAIVVNDTGSTDSTARICIEHGALLRTVPWTDFSTNRNQVLECASAWAAAGDILLVVDGGSLLKGKPTIKDSDANAWNINVWTGRVTCKRPQMFRAGAGWKYAGRVHEAASGPGTVGDSNLIADYCLKDPAREARLPRDLSLLEDDYSARGRFYYAQTLEQLGQKAQAFFWYLHRAERADGWIEERCQAYIRAIPMAPSFALAQWCCGQALKIDPSRGEAWLQFALYGASVAQNDSDWRVVGIAAEQATTCAPYPGAFCIDTEREWRARELVARVAFWTGRKAEAKALWLQLLDETPDHAHVQIRENLKFCDD
jgi:glycosyltransferase involved in cell wall biosynthesis